MEPANQNGSRLAFLCNVTEKIGVTNAWMRSWKDNKPGAHEYACLIKTEEEGEGGGGEEERGIQARVHSQGVPQKLPRSRNTRNRVCEASQIQLYWLLSQILTDGVEFMVRGTAVRGPISNLLRQKVVTHFHFWNNTMAVLRGRRRGAHGFVYKHLLLQTNAPCDGDQKSSQKSKNQTRINHFVQNCLLFN